MQSVICRASHDGASGSVTVPPTGRARIRRFSMLQKWLAADRIALPLLAGVMIAGLAGCGSGSGAVPGPTPTPNPAPNLGLIAPSNAPAGALAFILTVNGSNFVASSTVQWDGSSRTTTFVSSSQLQAKIT